MLEVAPYSWDGVEEPTAEELAEIDAAIAAAPPPGELVFVNAWMASYPVKKALEVVGPPDGSGQWLIDFTAQMFAHTEAVAPYKVDARKALHHATAWHNALGTAGWNKRGQLPLEHLRALVDMMPIEAVAHYISASAPTNHPGLQATKERIEEWLFPCLDLDKARKAVSLVKAGTPPMRAAKQVGVGWDRGLAVYLKALRVEAVCQQSDGRRRMPASVRQRIRELALEGLSPKQVHEKVNAEHPMIGVLYPAVKMAVLRARASK